MRTKSQRLVMLLLSSRVALRGFALGVSLSISVATFVIGRVEDARAQPVRLMNEVATRAVTQETKATAKDAGQGESVFNSRRMDSEVILDLENAVSQAELVVAVRLGDVSELKIVHGGKTESVTYQFKFEPVRILKGIFARDALLLTDSDLRIYQFGGGPNQIKRGQMLLLMLARSGPGYFNCNSAGSLEESIPRLSGGDDPLLTSVEALIDVTQQSDREARVGRLLEALRRARGSDAIPLLQALRRRGLLAAQTPGAIGAVVPLMANETIAVRDVAAQTLAALLYADYLEQKEVRKRVSDAIVGALRREHADLQERIATLDVLAAIGNTARENEDIVMWLKADRATRSFAERAAVVKAISRIGMKEQKQAIANVFDALPYDAPADAQTTIGKALIALDPSLASECISRRMKARYAAGDRIASEIALTGELSSSIAVPILLEVARRNLNEAERLAFAVACHQAADQRLLPVLGELLDPRFPDVRSNAVEALQKINTDEAASLLFPHLGEEVNWDRKLVLAEFLGRHGFRTGYPYAIEHMSAPMLREKALDVLVAVKEPKAVAELRKIWDNSHDLAWNAAAIRALGRLGQRDIVPKLLPLANDPRNALSAPALLALSDLGVEDAVPAIRAGLESRNDDIVMAAAQAAGKLLRRPEIQANDIRDRLAALLADASASVSVRSVALDAMLALDDPQLGKALGAAARDANLEGNVLLNRVEAELASRKERLMLP